MLVILTDKQVLSPQQVCEGCLLANRKGLPRWHQGKLSCGRALAQLPTNLPILYECQMGFRVASVD